MDEAQGSDNKATLRVLEAAVALRQQQLDDEEDYSTSDDNSSSSPLDDAQCDSDMELTEGDQWWVPNVFHTTLSNVLTNRFGYFHIHFGKCIS